MGLSLTYTKGQTPLDEEEKDGLKIKSLSTRAELDEFEQKNIEEALLWTLDKKWSADTIFTENFVCMLHQKMYREVWKWAGTFRKSEKNIGIKSYLVATELKYLLDDALFWVQHETYSPDELSLRFKHRLVSIHCFPNGNGRHSRLMADVISEKIFGNAVFSWGAGSNLSEKNSIRDNYIQSLKTADKGNYIPLIEFARS